MPVISPLPSGFSSTIVWQPMPPPTSVPSGALTEELCGQPEQKNGARWAIGSSAGRAASESSRRRCASTESITQAARAQAAGHGARDEVGVEVELHGQQALAVLVALADDARGAPARRRATSLSWVSTNGPFSSTTRISSRPCANSRDDLALQRPDHPELEDADAGALEGSLVEAEAAQRIAAGRSRACRP